MKSILTLLTIACTSVASATSLLYLEDFSNTSAGVNFNSGWSWGNADALMSSLVVYGAGVRHEVWSQSALPATGINNFPIAGGSDLYGVPFTPFSGGTSQFMYTLEVASLGLTVSNVAAFQADVRKNTNTNRLWFGIMTGNVWYFTENVLNPILDEGVLRRYNIPMTNMVQINQVWNGATGWGVARTVEGTNIIGPANFSGSEVIEGFALLFSSHAAETGNLYLDNFGLVAVPEPSTYAALLGLMALGFIVYRRIWR
jgi:hypothetical protein